MKTLVYKDNPQIRITAPEINSITLLGYTNYEIEREGTLSLFFNPKDWTLVEEEPVDLEKEIDNYMDGYFSECQDGTLLNEGGSELQYEDVGRIAKYFYELGRKGGKI